ncbi:MAG TPA: FAD-dependent oxidoreductase, partial [Polyangiaceae bacterium]
MTLPTELTLDLGLGEPDDPASIRRLVAKALGTSEESLPACVLRKRSLDARRGSVRFHLLIEVGESDPVDLGAPHPRDVGSGAPRAIVVGDGPTGLFCAYELARRGVRSVVVDRGKLVQPRRRDLKGLTRHGVVDPDSNYCFGEGGAGTYSDGKLYTRAHKRGSVRDVIEILARHGAPDSILTEARPHIGSNRLPKVVSSMREELERVGVEFRFGARVVALLVSATGSRRVRGVRFEDGIELEADFVVLATGHSASDVYEMLLAEGVRLEP